MAKIIESVPNISEGRNASVIEACVDQIRQTPGCTLLQYSSDTSHNRTVITCAGEPEALGDAMVDLAAAAVARIDLNHHTGAHPRMGAIDVIPFVPVAGVTMAECTALAEHVVV